MKKALVEMIGTFFLVLVIALTGNPLAIGVALMALVYAGGHISGGHYNPAVTLAVLMQKKIRQKEVGVYIFSQLIGAILASLAVIYLKGTPLVVSPALTTTYSQALLTEVLFTFALVTVVLNVAVSEKNTPNDFYGLAIGFTVMAGAFAGGAISGGAYNPAVGVGPMIVNSFRGGGLTPTLFSLYTIGPFLGAILASLVYKYVTSKK
ncbi:hypothetical protein A3G67_04395 [Candidatus Roizmanbacteria bacterium RIFCSPLOWO2_12_FULL_40_12]|uniref:Porin n=1 Tax=Candidatus Roizmanbacteria bacterium RIFCSPLOWO2_01_FULL_40_42 TaxID=1802066 RepID=A0A1F7J4T3_9BACT|nr:MAG: hypothetical protein A2779_04755 [Candidatus Roizmanbacteria bacterium RIFCSPHIGHO2_01_FULL_40_98]OGK27406.1 MAG: hypothetical protein A3C31_05080 [Candidatus Roizmanbacteria bacterium RIFCSPHIGHO2_02_FULL_40_53]OGK30745.1 MAG: hypothetical protein A2W49_01960 [Candidatus Roizmanbacteria bacterium RIFCSPHIGHO2_12_41_18]OGK36494.1 MAG: hypothetical protein A3E69_02705 [Candidatus Roizmanbacteria bacterium RIFCSPHIGHO2_12_FULL_40_130]OGK50616.1 MAG: hypothetical protein A3B50_02435 [Candi